MIQTSINLSSSNSGEQEQFGSSLPGRVIVRAAMSCGKVLHQIIPVPLQRGLNSRFEPKALAKGEAPLPFDYVRASLNNPRLKARGFLTRCRLSRNSQGF